MQRLSFVPFLLAISLQLSAGQSNLPAARTANVAEQTNAYVPVHEFDPKRDASADIQAAIAEAERTHKRIILYLGGNWCPFCGQLDQLFHAGRALLQIREASFITVYVYYGPGNHNRQALSSYGKFVGIPHYFVLNSDGSLAHSEHLLDLRSDGAYSPQKMRDFLVQWSPASMPTDAKISALRSEERQGTHPAATGQPHPSATR